MNKINKKNKTIKDYCAIIIKDWRLYLMLLPIIIFFVLWKYLPMTGLLVAFKDYQSDKGVLGSNFLGFYHIKSLLFGSISGDFWRAFRNTFVISFQGLIFGFPVPIILALFFSEIKSDFYRSVTQILSYLPKFISTVIITTMITMLVRSGSAYNEAGFIARILYKIGLATPENRILYEPQYFRAIYHISGIWQGAGYGSIVYFAAVMAISPTNYEAAKMDGANKLAQIRYVTLPGMASTLTIMLILRIGNILSIGYEKVLLLYNTYTYEVADVISTFVIRYGMERGNSGLGSAADMFNSIIAMILVLGANFISRRASDTSLF